jgi:hypothetical protein
LGDGVPKLALGGPPGGVPGADPSSGPGMFPNNDTIGPGGVLGGPLGGPRGGSLWGPGGLWGVRTRWGQNQAKSSLTVVYRGGRGAPPKAHWVRSLQGGPKRAHF